ncbi:MAG: HIRAN domain-containing protein [Cyanobacteria bacterium P01_A01_bin.84]
MKTLFLAWQDPNSRTWYPIGRLTYDGEEYKFVYLKGAVEARDKCSFNGLYSFPEFHCVYKSTIVFPLFSNRVMPRSRPDYKNYIERLNIPENEDEPIDILARSGGKKATDTLEVFPCPTKNENGLYEIKFFARGLRYFPSCSVERILKFEPDELLYISHELQNPYDSKALMLCTEDHHCVGYCPRYLNNDFIVLMEENPNHVKVQVERVNPAPTPLQLRLMCNLTAECQSGFSPFSSKEYQPIVDDVDVDYNVA